MTRTRIVALGALFFAAGCAGVGCAHRGDSPAVALAAFGDAVARGDLRRAYALTSDGFRGRTPFEAFAAPLRAPGTDLLARQLADDARQVPPRIVLALPLGDEAPLVFENGVWRIDGAGIDPWGQATPRAALRTFVRAVDLRRYDILLRLIPDRYRPGLDEEKLRVFWEGGRRDENRVILERLRSALGGAMVESGEEAQLPIGPDRVVRLAREDGRWKVEDPDAR